MPIDPVLQRQQERMQRSPAQIGAAPSPQESAPVSPPTPTAPQEMQQVKSEDIISRGHLEYLRTNGPSGERSLKDSDIVNLLIQKNPNSKFATDANRMRKDVDIRGLSFSSGEGDDSTDINHDTALLNKYVYGSLEGLGVEKDEPKPLSMMDVLDPNKSLKDIGDAWGKRTERFTDFLERMTEGKNLPERLQTTPMVASALFGEFMGGVVNDPLESAINQTGRALSSIIPDPIEKDVKQSFAAAFKQFGETDIGKSVIDGTVDLFEGLQWFEENHPDEAEALRGPLFLAEWLPLSKGIKLLKGPTKNLTKNLGGALEDSSSKGIKLTREALEDQKVRRAERETRPTYTHDEKVALLERGGAKSGLKPLGKVGIHLIDVKPTKLDTAVARAVKDIVIPGEAVDNLDRLNSRLAASAKRIDNAIGRAEVPIWNRKMEPDLLDAFMAEAKENAAIIFAKDKAVEDAYDVVLENFKKRLVKKNVTTYKGLYQAKKDFVKELKSKLPGLYTSDPKDNAKRYAAEDLSGAVTELLRSRFPKDKVGKTALKLYDKQMLQSRHMLIARNRIAKRIAPTVGRQLGETAISFLRQNIFTSLATGGIVTAAGVVALLGNPIWMGALAGAGAITIGQATVRSPQVKKMLIEGLRIANKTGQLAQGDKDQIRAMIKSLELSPSNPDLDDIIDITPFINSAPKGTATRKRRISERVKKMQKKRKELDVLKKKSDLPPDIKQ